MQCQAEAEQANASKTEFLRLSQPRYSTTANAANFTWILQSTQAFPNEYNIKSLTDCPDSLESTEALISPTLLDNCNA